MTSSTDYPTGLNPVYDRRQRPDLEEKTIDWVAAYDEQGEEINTLISFDYYMSMGVPHVINVIYQGLKIEWKEIQEAIYNWNQSVVFDEVQTIKYK